jgi:acetoin:2,6-dichlorophenolindophenol oxidoreductase subunit alpha
VNGELRIELHRRMLLARRFEERIEAAHKDGLIPGALHLAVGQEAVGVGACAALEDGDIVRSWVRGHHQAIGRGMPLRLLCAELMGKATGGMKGRGGHQFLLWREGAFLGGCGIVGSVLPVAAGHAMAQQLRGEQRITCCFFGDGGANIGPTHEALNLAGVWKLPIVFVCENNWYALSAPWPSQSASPDIARRADGYGIRGVLVDGNDVEAVYAATREARDAALAGEPTLIEARTYRLSRFSTGDLGGYVPEGEAEGWLERDPLRRSRAVLAEFGLLDAEWEARAEAEIEAEIEDALRFAEESPYPDPQDLHEGVLA